MNKDIPRRKQSCRRAEAEERILIAGVQVIAEKGLDGLTLADVGLRAGYSRGLPAHYFGSKDRFQIRLADYVVSSFRKHVLQNHRQPGLAGLVEVIETYFEMALEDPKRLFVLHIILSEAAGRSTLSPDIAELSSDTVRVFERYIQSGIRRGEIRTTVNAKAQGMLLLAAMRGVLSQWLVDRSIDLHAAGQELISTLRYGIALQANPPAGEATKVSPAVASFQTGS